MSGRGPLRVQSLKSRLESPPRSFPPRAGERVSQNFLRAAERVRTRIGDLDLDHATLEGFSIKSKSLLEALDIAKLDISEALGALHLTVLNDADGGDVTALEELGDSLGSGIVGEVAKVGGVGRSVGDLLREAIALANRVACLASAGDLDVEQRASYLGLAKRTCRRSGHDRWEAGAGYLDRTGQYIGAVASRNGGSIPVTRGGVSIRGIGKGRRWTAYHKSPRLHRPKKSQHQNLWMVSTQVDKAAVRCGAVPGGVPPVEGGEGRAREGQDEPLSFIKSPRDIFCCSFFLGAVARAGQQRLREAERARVARNAPMIAV